MKEATITLDVGNITFSAKHNMHKFDMNIDKVIDEWYDKTDSYTVNNFCHYAKSKNRNIICEPVK